MQSLPPAVVGWRSARQSAWRTTRARPRPSCAADSAPRCRRNLDFLVAPEHDAGPRRAEPAGQTSGRAGPGGYIPSARHLLSGAPVEASMPRFLQPEASPKTLLYLVRHGATEATLAQPARLQGRRDDAPLASLGVRQAEATRDFLAIRPIDHCYCSPLLRAVQTASIVAAPHGVSPQPVESLTECDVGRWEGLDWQSIRGLDPEVYERFMA